MSSPSPTISPTSSLSNLSLSDVTEPNKQAAAKLKVAANDAFADRDFTRAAKLYGDAIALNPIDPTLYCNRAYARMKLEEYGYALSDTTNAIELDPKYIKAYYRRALCHLQTLKPMLAIADFRKVVSLDPKNKLAKDQLDTTQRLVRRIEFEKAIELEEEQTATDRCAEIIKEGSCPVDTSYAGPKLQHDTSTDTYSIDKEFITEVMAWFRDGKSLPRRYVWEITLGAFRAFEKEESLVDVLLEEGMTCDVIGDVHGQYYDMLHLFSMTGTPTDKHCLLMNGDLVDRGSWSMEVIITAFALKWLWPSRMYINRGNHETKDMNRAYGFEGEAKHKHGELTYKLFAHVFTALPLATLISCSLPPVPAPSTPKPILSPTNTKRYMVVHGGLFSKDDVTLDDIRKVPRIGKQPGQEGIMCEILWTDPQEMPGRGPSKRGVGIAFGPDVTKRWCTANKVTGIFRSHEVRQDGYAIEHDGLCTTIFSAPNYVDQGGNKGAFVRINAAGTCEYNQFEAKPHPPLRPMAYASGGLANMMMA